MGCGSQAAKSYSITVAAGSHTRVDAPVWVQLPAGVQHADLMETTGGPERSVPGQLERDGDGVRLHWILEGNTPAGTVRSYRLVPRQVPGDPTTSRPAVFVHDRPGESLELRLGEWKVLRYNYGLVEPPEPEIPDVQARNAYIHPVWSPSGRLVTDDYAPDHLHQRGIWFAWTKTSFEGRTPDFWNLGSGSGTVRFAGLDATTSGPVFGGFRVRHRHVDLSAPAGEVDVLQETWDVKLFAIGNGQGSRPLFLFDLFSVQECAGSAPLILPEYRYGGLAFRGSAEWRGDREEYRTSAGRTKKDADRTSAVWCQASGQIEGENAGIVIFSHPGNYRSPQPLRVFPGAPYFCWAPTQQGEMSIRPGEPYISHYRFLVFDGDLKRATIDRLWNDFAHPPAVTLKAVRQ